jgi:hypothetical protein
MNRYRVYRRGTEDEDSLVILDFATIPPEEISSAEQEAHDMAFSHAVGAGDSIEEVCDQYPQVAGFEPWLWKGSSWQPQGLNRDLLVAHRRHAAKSELAEFLHRFIDVNAGYLAPQEIRQICEDTFTEAEQRARQTPD